jgi:uncharacterized membrane protein
MGRAVLFVFLLLAIVNLACVLGSKSNSTATKFQRCSACQIFVKELHDQMSKAANTEETILKQAAALVHR